jgi:hypothetical protein
MTYQCPHCKRVFDFGDDPPYLYCPSCYHFDGQNFEEIALIQIAGNLEGKP